MKIKSTFNINLPHVKIFMEEDVAGHLEPLAGQIWPARQGLRFADLDIQANIVRHSLLMFMNVYEIL